ncbi:hypothetical protein CK203_042892 [Vitis vinifera]|uniref:Uncharacterized protein n=1 Tax=Vitis vinifera TaxID=29760 RepID=A0A438HUT8_VITVI|nr:hypothetical protein CK203_042892 [Vitis vinifera]
MSEGVLSRSLDSETTSVNVAQGPGSFDRDNFSLNKGLTSNNQFSPNFGRGLHEVGHTVDKCYYKYDPSFQSPCTSGFVFGFQRSPQTQVQVVASSTCKY